MLKKDYFKKNLLRVKQLADQNLGRAEKTEVLSEDLVSAEKRVEVIKQACHNTSKKVAFLVQGSGSDMDKRRRKIPESSLAATMQEGSALLNDGLLCQILHMCSDAEGSLGEQRLQHEMTIETSVMSPLQNILDIEIPALLKLKRQLSKLTLDMDSAKARWHSAVRETAGSSNMMRSSAKADTIKEEYEEAQTKVEQSKDQYTTDLYNFLAREPEVAERFIELVQSQANYHRQALDSLEQMIPKMRDEIQKYSLKPVYGTPLEDHLSVTDREIAFVIEECVCTLLEIGTEEEGLFRIAGSASKLKKLKAAFDAGAVEMTEFVTDVPAIAGALKLYLRELPEPLLTFSLYTEWMQAAQIQDKNQRLQALWVVLDKLPSANYKNLRYLIKFLSKMTEYSDSTKMNASNMGIVIGPNLLWSAKEIDGHSVVSTSIQSAIVESLIQHANWFFPGDVEFTKTPRGSPRIGGHMLKVDSDQDDGPSLSSALGLVHHTLTAPLAKKSEIDNTEEKEDSPEFSVCSLDESVILSEPPLLKAETRQLSASDGDLAGIRSSISLLPDMPVERFFKASAPVVMPHSSVHGDFYNTAFALQSLGVGSSDYLSQVRSLWDTRFDKKSSKESILERDIEFGSDILDSPPCEGPTQVSTSSHCRNDSTGGSTVQASPPSPLNAAPPVYGGTNTLPPPESDMSTPSPKVPRRGTKKQAPRPPTVAAPPIPDREHVSPPPIPDRETPGQPPVLSPVDKTVPTPPTRSTSLPPAADADSEPIPSPRSRTMERPSGPPPERPTGPPPERPPALQTSDTTHHLERPHGPPPERPHGPPPERPPLVPDRPPSMPDRPSVPPPERPIEPKRSSSNKPPRPQPPSSQTPAEKERSNSVTDNTTL